MKFRTAIPVITLALGAAVAAADPVAMVTDLQGRVAPQGQGAAPAILASLEGGATLEVAEGASLVVVYFESGREFAFKGPATVRFDAAQPAVLLGAKPESRDPLMGKLAGAGKIKPVGKVQAAVVMRGTNPKALIKLEAGAGTRVLEARPTFAWQAPDKAASYDFELSDESGRLLLETKVNGTSFTLPASVKLVEGATYTWIVGATFADGKRYQNAAEFTVAPAEQRREIESVRPGADAPIADKVTFAAWLDQLQFHDEARKYWKQVAAARGGDANLGERAR